MADHEDQGRMTTKKVAFLRCASNVSDELCSFRSCLRWICVDQSDPFRAILSWSVFFIFSIAIPLLSHFVLTCPKCDSKHQRPYNTLVQVSLTVISTISFLSLSKFLRRYGLRRFLFLDKLCDDSEKVRQGYTTALNSSLKLLSLFVLPCFIAEAAYKIWWYVYGTARIPFIGNVYVGDVIACFLELCSWLYRISGFFQVCVLFRLICHLQILRLQDFAQVFLCESDETAILSEHLKIRKQLKIISHRFRAFILSTLVFVTVSQFASLLLTTRSSANLNLFKAGDLALCSTCLVTGVFICLRSAAKITHRAQSIVGLAAKWHVCSTCNSFESDCDTPNQIAASCQRVYPSVADSDDDDETDDDDDMDDPLYMPIQAQTISFHKRQALVIYFENNKAGITLFGFILDRRSLNTIFGIELSLVLWLLGKTIGIS